MCPYNVLQARLNLHKSYTHLALCSPVIMRPTLTLLRVPGLSHVSFADVEAESNLVSTLLRPCC